MTFKSISESSPLDTGIVVFVLTLLVAVTTSGFVTPPPPRSFPASYAAFQAAETKRYSQFNEELIIRHYFSDRRGGVFLDVGCAFPATNSTTYFLEAHLDWTGIGIDAVEGYGPLWKNNRPRAKFFHYAVSDSSGDTITFYQAAYPIISSM